MGKIRKACALMLALGFLASLVFLQSTVEAQPRTIIVPTDYPNIQAAIGNASSGDTIFVKKGTYNVSGYYDGLLIDKSISLIGEDSQSTIINAQDHYGSHDVIHITADNVTIQGFNIDGGGIGVGIDIEDSYSHVPIGVQITGNYIHNCDFAGIITYSSTSTITGQIKYLPAYLTVSGNNISHNEGYGIYMSSSNSTVTGNIIDSNNEVGMIVDECLFLNITNNRISNNGLSPFSENESGGLWLRWWGPFYITGNTIVNNHGHGIGFEEFCNYSTVYGNEIAYNDIGIREFYVSDGGFNNVVYHNNFVNNGLQVAVNQSMYSANNYRQVDIVALNSSREGNYWSDYLTKYTNASEVGTTGIGNTPYVIDNNNIDYYPLIKPVDISLNGSSPSPTPQPTTSPTPSPTSTQSPTSNPTTNPTAQPTLPQTITPTSNPSTTPNQTTNNTPTSTPTIPEIPSITLLALSIITLSTVILLKLKRENRNPVNF